MNRAGRNLTSEEKLREDHTLYSEWIENEQIRENVLSIIKINFQTGPVKSERMKAIS